jgi:hypothetical protein
MIFWGSSAVVPLLVDESPRQMRDKCETRLDNTKTAASRIPSSPCSAGGAGGQ